MGQIWFNGVIVDEQQARLSVLDRGVIWGYGLFETLRAYEGRVWAVEAHYNRLAAGGRQLEIAVPALEVLDEAMNAVLDANGLGDAGVRVTITRGAGPADPHCEPTEDPNTFVTAWPLRDYTALYTEGASLVSLRDGGRPLAGVKSTSYAPSVAGRLIARRAGADDGVFVAEDGRVLEATGSNLAVCTDDKLLTPEVGEGLLPGVTRATVLDLANGCGLEPQERSLRVDDLLGADEVVLTSTLREVYSARSFDGHDLRRRGIAERLRTKLRDLIFAELGA